MQPHVMCAEGERMIFKIKATFISTMNQVNISNEKGMVLTNEPTENYHPGLQCSSA